MLVDPTGSHRRLFYLYQNHEQCVSSTIKLREASLEQAVDFPSSIALRKVIPWSLLETPTLDMRSNLR